MHFHASDHTYDVLVCGAGIAGLASARALSDLGLHVLVVDGQRTPPDTARGEVLQPGALRVLRCWGAERLLRERGAVQLDRLVVREADGSELLALDYGHLPEGDQQLLVHEHLAIQTALTDGLGPRVEIRRGTPVRQALRDSAGRVIGLRLEHRDRTIDVWAPLVVAADGIASRLRRTAGIRARHTTYPHRLLALEFNAPSSLPTDFSAYRTSRGLRLTYPLPRGRGRVYLQTSPHELRGLRHDHLTRWAIQALEEVPPLRALVPLVPDALAQRQLFTPRGFVTDQLVVPGMALVGEASYAMHPMAAQGMNLAVTSAAALADQIGRHLGDRNRGRGHGPLATGAVDAAFAAYQAGQLPALARTAHISAGAAHLVTDLSQPGRLAGRRTLRRTDTNPRFSYQATRNLAGVDPEPFSTLDRLRQIGLLPLPDRS